MCREGRRVAPAEKRAPFGADRELAGRSPGPAARRRSSPAPTLRPCFPSWTRSVSRMSSSGQFYENARRIERRQGDRCLNLRGLPAGLPRSGEPSGVERLLETVDQRLRFEWLPKEADGAISRRLRVEAQV